MRAMHLELADNLTTELFILALNHLARRGCLKVITSDNGSNFIEAESELKESIKSLNNERITEHLNSKYVTGNFNPPLSPRMGGLWESIIKSIKRALWAVSSERVFTDESLRTYQCEVESILNKHPLTSVSDDINDFEAVTPDHLLIGYQNEANAINSLCHKNNLKVQWKNIQSANMFWKCWLNHYLPTLTNRQKQAKTVENLSVNDLVIIKTKDTPRSH